MKNHDLRTSNWKRWLSFLLILCGFWYANAKDLKKIFRALEKEDLPKALELISESLSEEPVNPGARYVLAGLLATDSLTLFDLDSARITVWQALEDYEQASEDELEDLEKNRVSIQNIQDLDTRIRDKHYARAMDTHTIVAFEAYMGWYAADPRNPNLVKLRDSLVWKEVKPQYTSTAYQQFFLKYPQSYYSPEARFGYDSLLYLENTRSDKLSDYVDFLKDQPETPYRDRAEKIIFERMTASNIAQDYERYFKGYPNSKQIRKAVNIWYHLNANPDLSGIAFRDSLQRVSTAIKRLTVPIYEDGEYRFMTSSGAMMDLSFAEINRDYFCGDIQTDFFFGGNDQQEIYNRSGNLMYTGSFDLVEDLGLGVLLLEGDQGKQLIHKSGFEIWDGLEDAAAIGDQWLRIKVNGKYGLISNTGYPITLFKYDDIYRDGVFWVFEKGESLAVYTTEKIMTQLQDDALELEFKFDDIEVVEDSLLIGFRGDWECLMNEQLSFMIPWGDYEVTPGTPFHYARTTDGYRFSQLQANSPRGLLTDLLENEVWIGVEQDSLWTLYNKNSLDAPKSGLDTLYLAGDFTAVYRDDSARMQVLFPNGIQTELTENQQVVAVSPLQNEELADYITILDEEETSLWNKAGALLFSGKYEEIKPLDDSLFITKQRGKLGMINGKGEELIAFQYDAMQESDGLIFLLSKGKIGAYDIQDSTLILPRYESKLERFGPYYITRAKGKYGIIDESEDEIVDFDYDQIRYWNDSTAWVKDEADWSLMNLNDGSFLIDTVSNFEMIVGREDLQIATFYGERGYGLASSRNGELLPPKFNEIRNLGNQEDPLFTAEVYSPETGFYILLYLNEKGEKLGSYAFRVQEYEKIYCED
ncbi:MAG: WG repeat-containing protein [Cytophagales bacterium]|nr:WG repeat-containing protein [Cytophagales bacterium]